MSNYSIIVKRAGKIGGTTYKVGDSFPYEPEDLTHERLLQSGVLGVKKNTPAKSTKKASRK